MSRICPVKELFQVPNPGIRPGLVQVYEFVAGTNSDGEAGFVTIINLDSE